MEGHLHPPLCLHEVRRNKYIYRLSQVDLSARVPNTSHRIDSVRQNNVLLEGWSPVSIPAGSWADINVRCISVWLHKLPGMSSHGRMRLVITVIYKH